MTFGQLMERLGAVKGLGPCRSHPGGGLLLIGNEKSQQILVWPVSPCSDQCIQAALGTTERTIEIGPLELEPAAPIAPDLPGTARLTNLPASRAAADPESSAKSDVFQSTACRTFVVEINEPESRLEPEISTPTSVSDLLTNPGNPRPGPTAAVKKPRRADLEAEIRRLHAEGLSNREIARRVQMHHTSVGRILKSSDTPLPEIRR